MKIVEIELDTVDSTQLYAKKHGKDFDPNALTCILAEEQTAGIGQFQRKWISPRGVNLYVTFYFHLLPQSPKIPNLALLLSLSIKEVLVKEGLNPTMKWPNDIFLNHKKVAGVLCETIFHEEHTEILLGFGLNVNMEKKDLETIDQPATSLKNETGFLWDKMPLFNKIKNQFLLDINK